ncbi:MAG: hypothetical protein LBU11_02525, partial [Zoogloeaceae bacterium]|nr:hypothetical protein [Zoogloeaceae bacterium]
MNSWFWFFFPILPGLGFAALGFILDSREVSGAKHFTKFSLALAGMVISLPLILNDVASSPTLVGIVLGVWIVRMLWVISIAM